MSTCILKAKRHNFHLGSSGNGNQTDTLNQQEADNIDRESMQDQHQHVRKAQDGVSTRTSSWNTGR